MSKTKNDIAWEKLFDKYSILNNIHKKGHFVINSSTINEFREARLMTKFDFRSQLPALFADNKLSILPISRGSYVLSTFEMFKNFDSNAVPVTRFEFPSHLESIDSNNITSESTALNCAYISGMLEDFTGDEQLKPTISGRMSSGVFNFSIQTSSALLPVRVNKAQLEIDGGYEGINSLNLVEVKNSISRDFLVRQLFYPFKLWEGKVTKPVRNLFLTYTNGIFHFREYVFTNINDYNSAYLVKQKKYVLYSGVINLEVIQKTLHQVDIVSEPSIPFPQANSFERIINLCELLQDNGSLSKEEITDNYDFDKRQTNYYTDAGRYLGWIEKVNSEGGIYFQLTTTGSRLFELSITLRQIEFVKTILSHVVFKRTLELYFKKLDKPTKEEIVQIMKTSNLYNVNSESTFERRASTISRWIDWILSLVEE